MIFQPTHDLTVPRRWLEGFSTETGVAISGWAIVAWGVNFRVEGIKAREGAERLAAFLKARHPVTTCVYDPLKNGYEVPVVHIT